MFHQFINPHISIPLLLPIVCISADCDELKKSREENSVACPVAKTFGVKNLEVFRDS